MNSKKTLKIITCDNYKREFEQILLSEDFKDVELVSAGLRCGRPGPHWQSVSAILPHDTPLSDVRLLGCACLSAHDTVPKALSALRCRPNAHGAYLFAPKDFLDTLVSEGSYLVTPGWLTNWRQRIHQWGFDETLAREYFSESAVKIVLLDTGIDAGSNEHLIQFAEFVQRPHESFSVGVEMLRLSIWNLVLEWRLERLDDNAAALVAAADRKKTDYAMSVEILGELARTHTESDTIAKIMELFSALFAPEEIAFIAARDTDAGSSSEAGEAAADAENELHDFRAGTDPYKIVAAHHGFLLRLSYDQETLGVLILRRISFPEFGQHYINLSLALSTVCGLALKNSRVHDELLRTNEALTAALDDVQTLSGLVPICSYCKKIRDDSGYWNILEAYLQERTSAQFSHGVCPDCKNDLMNSFDL